MKTKWTEKAKTNKEYNIALKNYKCYCMICNRRAGMFNAYCGPQNKKISKNWKQYRKTQYNETKDN